MNSWIESIKQIFPDYDNIKSLMEEGAKVRPILKRKGKVWRISVEEVYPEELEFGTTTDPDILNEAIDWTTTQLSGWPNVRRMSWQDWDFKRKSDVDKFITIYYLRWAT
jgi:hypothetical protein